MKIEEFKDITIAYMRNIGEYGNKNEKLMVDFKNFLKENNLFTDTAIILGIALDKQRCTRGTNKIKKKR